MIRKAFYMEVKPGCIEEYTKAHNPIPAELKAAMQRHGIHNYSIFHHPESNVLVGYMEIESEEEWAKQADEPINRKWWDFMADIMETNPDNSPVCEDLHLVFHLE